MAFYRRNKYQEHSYGMEGWGWAGSHEVADKGYVFTKTSQIASIGAHFHLSISHKAAKSMAILITQSYGELQLAVCFLKEYPAIWRWYEHSWTSDKPQKQATAKAA